MNNPPRGLKLLDNKPPQAVDWDTATWDFVQGLLMIYNIKILIFYKFRFNNKMNSINFIMIRVCTYQGDSSDQIHSENMA